VGSWIGRYELRALLGTGGMGAVYEAYDAELDRAVALKVLKPELSEALGRADRLVHESRLMARIAHPSVITVHDVGRDGDAVFLAMELIRGSTLAAWLRSHELDWRATVALFERAGHGLAAAHGAGIVHRDFKPENVLVACDADKVVVTDFGIARGAMPAGSFDGTRPAPSMTRALTVTLRDDTRRTTNGALLGTPAYMAPEQITKQAVDHRADIFAFSVALWEALFRQRPFAGTTLLAIFEAMKHGPRRPPAGAARVPRRLVRALEKGLSLEPCDRWDGMPELLAELARIRSGRRLPLAAGGAGIVAFGIAAAVFATRGEPAVDGCARALALASDAYNPAHEAEVRKLLAHDPKVQGEVLATLARTAESWRATHSATCHADRDIIQDPKITACLDARRIELAGSVDDLIAGGSGGAAYAAGISQLPGDPLACGAPAPGLLFARVPADRELRRQVTALRSRLADAYRARDRGDVTRALDEAMAIAVAAATLWPPVHAEAQLALGLIQHDAGDSKRSLATLRDAAAAAERAHHDEVAAYSWIWLALNTVSDDGDPQHGLEYAASAEAAAERAGRPPAVLVRLDYAKGIALTAANRSSEGEIALRNAVALAKATRSDYLAVAIQGLGFLYEDQGRYKDAVAAYREAIAHLPRSASGEVIAQPVFFERLAINLAELGQLEEAETVARRAVEIADRTLPRTHDDWPAAHMHLAEVLQSAGHHEAALAEATLAVTAVANIRGTRDERYGEVIAGQAGILNELGRSAEAEGLYTRGCDIIAFALGDDHGMVASCETEHSGALIKLGRAGDALAKLDRALPRLIHAFGESHPQVGYALLMRGTAQAALGHHRDAVADLERAVEILTARPLDPRYLAVARWRLGKELSASDPARARAEITQALAIFETAGAAASKERDEAAAWLKSHSAPAPRPRRF